MNSSILNKFFLVLIFFSFLFGLYIAITNSYGYDNDTYGMLQTFINLKQKAEYFPSRIPGSPVAELGIGSLAWIGGSKLTNSFTLILFFSSLLFFPFIFKKSVNSTSYLPFLALCATSPLLLFENTHTMDYSWGLFFFTIGSFIKLRTKFNLFSIVFFALAIGSRFIYFIYIVPILLLNKNEKYNNKLSNRIFFLIFTLSFSASIYIIIWHQNNLFNYLFNTGIIMHKDFNWFGSISRFLYKNIMNFGLIQSFIIAIFISYNLANIDKLMWIKKNNLLSMLIIIFLNMIIFFKIPFEPMYLQISVISIYYIISMGFELKNINKILILVILSMNLFGWFKTIDILEISHEYNERCTPVKALQAKPNLFLNDGKYNWLEKNNKNVICYSKKFEDINGVDFSEKILKGKSLR